MKVRPSAGVFGDPVTQADEAHRAGRTSRDWAVDSLCFLLGIGFTALAFVDGIDRRLPTVPVAVDAAPVYWPVSGCGCAGGGRLAWR